MSGSAVPYKLLATALLLSAAFASAGDSIRFLLPDDALPVRHGYLILDTDIGRKVSELRLDSGLSISDIPQGRSIRLIALREGSYHWELIALPHFDLPFKMDLSDRSHWGFKIERGKLNYIGRILVGDDRAVDAVDVRLRNRATMTWLELSRAYPEIVNSYEFVYTGALEDDFPVFLRAPHADE